MTEGATNFKDYPTIGACGIDCGLCPRYQTKAASRCPGCVAKGFLESGGQWCKITRCAVRDRGYETCAECAEFPCRRLEGWDSSDSFVSHLKSLVNIRSIKELGIKAFDAQQRARMNVLGAMLDEFDEGRSKSYCCAACSLLPVDALEAALQEARREVDAQAVAKEDRKSRARILHHVLDAAAERLGINLKLRR